MVISWREIFSGTNFADFASEKLSEIFKILGFLEQTFTLKLHNCKIHEKNQSQLDELTLALSTISNMREFEFFRSPDCSEKAFHQIIESVSKNNKIEIIKIDGFRVTPSHISEILTKKKDPTYVLVLDGLVIGRLFKPANSATASNDPVSNEPSQENQIGRKRKIG